MKIQKRVSAPGGEWILFIKREWEKCHVQTKGVYVWYVIYFTSLSYHRITITSTFHKEFHKM